MLAVGLLLLRAAAADFTESRCRRVQPCPTEAGPCSAVLSERRKVSSQDCQAACAAEPECEAANYVRSRRLCQLFARVTAGAEHDHDCVWSVYRRQSDDGRYVRLRSGLRMPLVGLGTYKMSHEEAVSATTQALGLGYRLVDTAARYGNEEAVGEAVRASGVHRDDVWVTSKIWTDSHSFDAAYEAGKASQQRLGVGAVDLLLIHSPTGGSLADTWRGVLQLRADGVVKSVGVSNFGVKHMEELRSAGLEMPEVNQIELNPLVSRQRERVLRYCREHGVVVTAYGSLYAGDRSLMDSPALIAAATRAKKTTAQVLLRWAVQQSIAVIPKSTGRRRLAENLDATDWELTDEEMEAVSALEGSFGVYRFGDLAEL